MTKLTAIPTFCMHTTQRAVHPFTCLENE